MTAGALWVRVDGGLLVGNDGGRYLGSIEAGASGEFVAYGPHSELLGRYVSVEEAKAAAERHVAAPSPASPRRRARSGRGVLAEARAVVQRVLGALGSRDRLSA